MKNLFYCVLFPTQPSKKKRQAALLQLAEVAGVLPMSESPPRRSTAMMLAEGTWPLGSR